MVICSFIGHSDVYDADMETRLQTEINKIIEAHANVEFLIYLFNNFGYICLLAALRARTYQPQKVTITLVLRKGTEKYFNVPVSMFDKTVVLNFEDFSGNDMYKSHYKMLKWMTQKSTYLITYCYDNLYEPNCLVPKLIAPLEIISLTTPETESAILEAATTLTENEQIAFYKKIKNCTLKEAGQAMGISPEGVRRHLYQGSKKIRKYLKRRYYQEQTAEQREGVHTCGLFALGEDTCESLSCFNKIIDFLGSKYNVKDVFVEHTYAQSGFIYTLTKFSQIFHITATLSDKFPSENDGYDDDLDNIETLLCPPCHAVRHVNCVTLGNVDQSFTAIADMLEQVNFCIYNSSAVPYAAKIKQYAAQTKQTVLLDMGKI